MSLEKDYKQMSDEVLMGYLSRGDERAFTALYKRYSSKLMSFFFRMLWKDKEKAEDFTQDLFSKIIQKPDSFDQSKKFSTWIYSIANNMCKNEYRKQAVRNTVHEKIHFSENGIEHQENEYDKALIKEELNRAINQLDEKHKVVFIMRYKQHLSVKEIAAVVNISEGTVKSRLFYSLKKLSEKLTVFKPEKLLQS